MTMTSTSSPRDTNRAWLLLGLFAALVAFLGGSSRSDAVQIVALRPFAALFLIPALYWLYGERSKAAYGQLRLIGWLVLGLTIWMVLQLVPLPPSVWHMLAGREPVAVLDASLGHADLWRPISMVPARGWNALASLIIPVTALLLFAATGLKDRPVFLLLIAIGCANALLGIGQIAGLGNGALYFYSITNSGTAVGFFANHNHSAVFSSLVLLIIAYVASRPRYGFSTPAAKLGLLLIFGLVFVAVLVGLSRAGFLTGMVALIASIMIYLAAGTTRPGKQESKVDMRRRRLALGGLTAGLLATVAIFALSDRLPVLDRIAMVGPIEDLRWSLWPVLREMMSMHWLVGTGFGSFEEVYHIYEPGALLMPEYINQAHNDWAQLLIEGGLPAVLLLTIFLAWLARALVQLSRSAGGKLPDLLFWSAVFAIMMVASLADYPLRAPLFQLAGVWLTAVFAVHVAHGSQARNG